jgi:DNA polymerase III alpha subunit (gram-positive type)
MKIFSFDAETNGLWGKAFAIAAIVYENDKEIARFVERCPIESKINPWVKNNVIPKIKDIPIDHDSYSSLLASFSLFYLKYKKDASIIVHMGVPVESRIISDMVDLSLIGENDGPYPLIDLSGMLLQVGEDPTSVDSYAKKYKIEVGEENTHNPLYDAEVTAKVFKHLLKNVR